MTAGHDFFDRHHLASDLVPTGHDNAHGLVQDDLLTGIKALGCLLVDRDPHLAATRMDVGRPIVVQLHHGPVSRGGLGELLHLVA